MDKTGHVIRGCVLDLTNVCLENLQPITCWQVNFSPPYMYVHTNESLLLWLSVANLYLSTAKLTAHAHVPVWFLSIYSPLVFGKVLLSILRYFVKHSCEKRDIFINEGRNYLLIIVIRTFWCLYIKTWWGREQRGISWWHVRKIQMQGCRPSCMLAFLSQSTDKVTSYFQQLFHQ